GMLTRWLAGALLFTFGFGSAVLAKLPKTAAASQEGVVEGNLKYVDGDDFRLVYPPGEKTEYLVVVTHTAGTKPDAAPQISTLSGLAIYPKKNLDRLTVYRVTPLLLWHGGSIGKCDGDDFCPLPPPPPPPDTGATFLKPGS
ncbi:MAG TPA: hypothetical protein VF173_16750, partial [Thermoanaerobaculia bacterium]|nr:hypothetical protein [Thermoanaerobaculia bacterium]